MKAQRLQTLVWPAAFFVASSAYSQIVRIEFNSQVTALVGSSLEGVTVGSIITGRVEVDLAHLPLDSNASPYLGNYSYGAGRPGFVLQFDTGFEVIRYDSVNAAEDGGVSPGIFLYERGDPSEHLGLQMRDQGDPYAAILSFDDVSEPLTLLNGDYFPEAVNLEAGLARATFHYFDNFGTDSIVARVTSASLTVDPGERRTGLLAFRVKASKLPDHRKRTLLSALEAAEDAFGEGRCAAALRHLHVFQKKVHAQVERHDSILASWLIAGAQSMINSGCGN